MKKEKVFVFFSYLCFFIISLLPLSVSAQNITQSRRRSTIGSNTPPRGWNSYDSFCWTVSEEEFLQNAEIVAQRLKPYGYNYVVVDYLWYRRKVPGAYVDSRGFDVIDEWGRMMPDPGRWPSSIGGKGFTEVAAKVHGMGLKFGIHVMRGISTQAVTANNPIYDIGRKSAFTESGKVWRARDIALPERACAWMKNGFMSINTNLGAGRAFLRSLYEQYAEWGVDFVKHDCVFGDDLDLDEITYVSDVLQQLHRPILYSLSPGTSVTPSLAKPVGGIVSMYRITGDDWDVWADVVAHFDIARDMASSGLIGRGSAFGRSWPDLDMLPLGWLTDPGSNDGPHRYSRLKIYEQRTQMTLWAFAKSPLMFGGDVRNLDDTTFGLITNPTLLKINYFSTNNMEFPYITSSTALMSKNATRSGQLKIVSNNLRKRGKVLGLTSCEESGADSWSVNVMDNNVEKICWKAESNKGNKQPVCLYKRNPLLASDEEIIANGPRQGKLQLSASGSLDICLDASPKRRLTAQEFRRGTFSRCRREANQMWELDHRGSLINSYSRQCAVVRNIEADAVPGGVRSWIAYGKKGLVYLAFFNLNQEKTMITAQISDLGKVLPIKGLRTSSCNYTEVWSNNYLGVTTETISYAVDGHDAALFVLQCQ